MLLLKMVIGRVVYVEKSRNLSKISGITSTPTLPLNFNLPSNHLSNHPTQPLHLCQSSTHNLCTSCSTINHIRINWQKFTLQSFGSENDLNYPHFLPIYSEESVKTCIGFIGSFTGTPHQVFKNHEKTVKTYKSTSKDYMNKCSIGFLCIFALIQTHHKPLILTAFTEKSRKIPQFQSVFYLFVPIFNHL